MTKLSKQLLITMSVAFAICVLGLLTGMVYYLSAVYLSHRSLETVMGNLIPFNKALGGIGILGILLFFAFLFSLISKPDREKRR